MKKKDQLISIRRASLLALAAMLALSACGEGELGETIVIDDYEFPDELVLAAAQVATTTTTTTAAPLAEEPAPVEVATPKAAAELLDGTGGPLPLPSSALLPDVGRIEPSIVTADGERRLLQDVSVSVSYDSAGGFVVEPAGWWVINFPLDRITGADGRTADQVSMALLGVPADELTNYYFYTAPDSGEPVQEAPVVDGPAPVRITRGPDLVVNNQDPNAADDNDGSPAMPLATIMEAVSRAVPGTLIHVYPGSYRESVVIDVDGTAEQPIRIEGIRGASGGMPIVTGNDVFSPDAWTPVDGMPGVFQAASFSDLTGSLSVNGTEFVERAVPADLEPGEYVVANGSEAYLNPRFDGDVKAKEGSLFTFGESQYIWEAKQADGGGFIDLGSDLGDDFDGGVYWGSAWVWVDRPSSAADHQWYESNDWNLQVSGPFRAGGVSGLPLSEQPYPYRVWLDGELLAGHIFNADDNGESDLAHPEIGRGDFGETWHGVTMREGWHHLVFQWDTTAAEGSDRAAPVFRFGIPEVVGNAGTSAAAPSNSRRGPSGQPQAYVSEYMVLGPVPADYDPTVYVRLPDDADPNDARVDIAARSGSVVSILGDYVELHGFDVRGGSQIEGEAQIAVGRRTDDPANDVFVQGAVVAGNLVSGGDYGGIDVPVEGDQGVAPITITNNWVVDAGAVGISAEGSSDRLTAETINDWAPGRTQVLVSENTIINVGWAGYSPSQDVSAILFERMAGSSIMRNTIIGGGPGISLRAESYGVRIDGNRIIDPWGWGVGVEANPGPNLVANNIVTGLRAGPEWMKAHLLTWDSDQTWLINNTTDGEWRIETGWYGDVGSWGAGGPENFDRLEYDTWDLSIFRRVYANNLLVGSFLGGIEDYLGNWGETDTFESNFREIPSPDPFDYFDDGAEKANVGRAFVARENGDYRLVRSSDLNTAGVVNMTSRLATHDIFGLLRTDDEATSVGAYRFATDIEPGSSIIEIELNDGTVARIQG